MVWGQEVHRADADQHCCRAVCGGLCRPRGMADVVVIQSLCAHQPNVLDMRFPDGVSVDGVDPVDDQRVGLGEREVGQVVDVGVERGRQHFARVCADRRPVTDIGGVGWSKKMQKCISGASNTSMWWG